MRKTGERMAKKMKKNKIRLTVLAVAAGLSALLLGGCGKVSPDTDQKEHEPITLLTSAMNYQEFEQALKEEYPEINLEFVSYTSGNGTGYSQYLLEHGEPTDIFPMSVFGMREEQKKYLLDLSGYEFLSNYRTADINQVSLDGAVYLVPIARSVIGLYYNKTLFEENGWEKPQSFEELKELTRKIKASGLDPVSAQFELPGNGFFDLFTFAKTGFLSTPDGIQWERDFKEGKATAEEGLADAAGLLQELIDCGFLDEEDTKRNYEEARDRFRTRKSAMYLNAGTIVRFTQNEDGSGDQYGIMPFYGHGEDDSVLITLPLRYFGLSRTLSEPGNEQKLEDALNIMSFLSTEEGMSTLATMEDNYVSPLKNTTISENSPFYEVHDVLQNGHTSTLAYAGYEPVIVGVGEKVQDWVAGKCNGTDVLALMDQLQSDYLENQGIPAIATASQDFTQEETAQLQADAFRKAAGTDIGLVSLGGYHNGVENRSGVCGRIFQGNISHDIVPGLVPANYNEPVCILTLSGKEIKKMLEIGYAAGEGEEGFPYIPAGITVIKDKDGSVREIIFEDGSAFEDTAYYTVAVDEGDYSDQIGELGKVQITELVTVEVVRDYFIANSPLAPLEHSLK